MTSKDQTADEDKNRSCLIVHSTSPFQESTDTFVHITPATTLLQSSVELDERKAAHLESRYVHQVYDKIADHFSHTRYRAWPQVKSFVQQLHQSDSLLDVGSGNGKNLTGEDVGPSLCVACDISAALLEICFQRNLQAVQADCLRLPFRDKSFDACICIAVLHHLANEKRRLQAINEIDRILRADGQALLYVWAFEQKNDRGDKSAYISRGKKMDKEDKNLSQCDLDENLYQFPIHRNGTAFEQQDMFVPWTDKRSKKVQMDRKSSFQLKEEEKNDAEDQELRYYHLFKRGELEALIERIDSLQIEQSYYDNGNWAVRVRKSS